MEKEYTSINEKIFNLLKEKGMSQKTLSDMTGISTSAISDWKNKGTIPSAANVQKICKALNVNSEEVLGKTKEIFQEYIIVDKENELYEFIKLYEGIEANARNRILAYALAMIKAEHEL